MLDTHRIDQHQDVSSCHQSRSMLDHQESPHLQDVVVEYAIATSHSFPDVVNLMEPNQACSSPVIYPVSLASCLRTLANPSKLSKKRVRFSLPSEEEFEKVTIKLTSSSAIRASLKRSCSLPLEDVPVKYTQAAVPSYPVLVQLSPQVIHQVTRSPFPDDVNLMESNQACSSPEILPSEEEFEKVTIQLTSSSVIRASLKTSCCLPLVVIPVEYIQAPVPSYPVLVQLSPQVIHPVTRLPWLYRIRSKDIFEASWRSLAPFLIAVAEKTLK